MARKSNQIHICPCGETNPENFYPKRKTKCKKCVNEISKNRYRNLPTDKKVSYINNQNKWASNNLIKIRVLAAKHRAKRKKLEFDIDEDFIYELLEKQQNKCYYTGVILDTINIGSKINQMNLNSLSIDRKDSKVGYIKSNIVLVTAIVNIMKNDLSEDIFFKTIDMICSYHKG